MPHNWQTEGIAPRSCRILSWSRGVTYAALAGFATAALVHLVNLFQLGHGTALAGYGNEALVAVAVVIAVLLQARVTGHRSELTERLQSCQDRTRIALDAANIAVWDWDLTTGEQNWSPNFHHLLGLDPNTTANFEAFTRLVHPEDLSKLKGDLEDALRDHRDHHCEFRVVWADGSVHWQLARARPFYDEQGKPIRIIGIAMDIDERKRAEERLRLQAEILNALANAVVITDPDAHIQWANPAFSKLTGYSLDEVRSKNPRFLKSGRHPVEFYAALWGTITAGNVWQGEVVNRRKDGALYDEEMTITPVTDDTGRITHFVAIKRDITGRKRLE